MAEAYPIRRAKSNEGGTDLTYRRRAII